MAGLIAEARRASGLSQEQVARMAGTSRPNVSAYERGHRSPTLDTLERLLAANGHRLLAVPIPSFEQRQDRRGKPFFVPHQLPQLPPSAAMAQVHLPMHVNWSNPEQIWDLSNRSQRLLAYQMLIAEGGPDDISTFVDGSLLIDLWQEMFVPEDIRAAWQPIMIKALGREAT